MTTFGYFLSSEEHGPRELVRQAKLAERAGFESLWISDHYHPWLDAQGQSPFVWSVIGAIAEATSLPVTTAVTCPLVRIHPAVIAQAAATSALLTEGRFRLGVGTGEALNEHIIDTRWPPAAERREMLEEAIEVMRELWSGKLVTHRGTHYKVDTARLYSLPDQPPPVYISGFGDKSIELAGRIGDGYILTGPNADMVEKFRASGGGGKPVQGGLKVCYADDTAQARETVHRLWPTQGIKGESAQLLPLPRHFEQLAEMVSEQDATATTPCGPDPEDHIKAIQQYVDAGVDEIHISQIGPDQDAFFTFYTKEILPHFH
ncbi:TIGR03557 family F420-dependent LLM class oxidoreductase [Sphaerisporangium corydalis]|uniref:TIGR03557 family F420-dependent LLM class oxidoreductase n=1 Tax=Sphaerisporangium corydalis TaxID=1441875 RepID=A0ABV9EMA2_9ACTN|nr:TIGR03557 family F420-dependent LLM class oxidoreductase [Sphaerisporangium corydalis]